MKNSAGIIFNENTDLIIEADPTGEVTSCRNVINGVEYVGGGGGESDLSFAEVTITNNSSFATTIYIPIANELTETPFDPACMANAYTLSGETKTFRAILYKGKLMLTANPSFSVSGNADIQMGQLIITGDCSITISD